MLAYFITKLTLVPDKEVQVLYVHRSLNNQGSGVRIILESAIGISVQQALRFKFKANKNQAEYEALLTRLQLSLELEDQYLHVKTDSQLVANQVEGKHQDSDEILALYPKPRTLRLTY